MYVKSLRAASTECHHSALFCGPMRPHEEMNVLLHEIDALCEQIDAQCDGLRIAAVRVRRHRPTGSECDVIRSLAFANSSIKSQIVKVLGPAEANLADLRLDSRFKDLRKAVARLQAGLRALNRKTLELAGVIGLDGRRRMQHRCLLILARVESLWGRILGLLAAAWARGNTSEADAHVEPLATTPLCPHAPPASFASFGELAMAA